MFGTKSHSQTAPAIDPFPVRGPRMIEDEGKRWPVWKLALLLYPFVAAAVAINLFLLSLLGQFVGLPVMSPVTAMIASTGLGLPATWLSGKWVRKLIDEAEDG